MRSRHPVSAISGGCVGVKGVRLVKVGDSKVVHCNKVAADVSEPVRHNGESVTGVDSGKVGDSQGSPARSKVRVKSPANRRQRKSPVITPTKTPSRDATKTPTTESQVREPQRVLRFKSPTKKTLVKRNPQKEIDRGHKGKQVVDENDSQQQVTGPKAVDKEVVIEKKKQKRRIQGKKVRVRVVEEEGL
ncbi:putative E3 ubiquitin-protein ligase [Sesbania bispinosa]|nr:putative E3 ubiquitin-protein ligase [Sesbania bispinosa]